MTDDVMKKVESLLFDEDEPEEEIEEEIKEEIKEVKGTKPERERKEVKEVKAETGIKMRTTPEVSVKDCIEISFDGYAVVSGVKIKTLPGSEIEVDGLRLVFKDSKVMVFV